MRTAGSGCWTAAPAEGRIAAAPGAERRLLPAGQREWIEAAMDTARYGCNDALHWVVPRMARAAAAARGIDRIHHGHRAMRRWYPSSWATPAAARGDDAARERDFSGRSGFAGQRGAVALPVTIDGVRGRIMARIDDLARQSLRGARRARKIRRLYADHFAGNQGFRRPDAFEEPRCRSTAATASAWWGRTARANRRSFADPRRGLARCREGVGGTLGEPRLSAAGERAGGRGDGAGAGVLGFARAGEGAADR